MAGLLDGVRARGALIGRTVLCDSWSVRFASGAQLSLLAMRRGEGWLVPGGGEPVRIGPGEVAVIRGPEPYTVSGDPAIAPGRVVTSEDYCADTARARLRDGLDLDPRTCGFPEEGSALLLSGVYEGPAAIGDRLLDALPRLLVVRADERDRTTDTDLPDQLAAIDRAVAADLPGQQAVLDRLLDLLLVSTLRAWFARPRGDVPGWSGAAGDPVVAHALRLLHAEPAHPWTVAELAARTGVSRAVLARRFTAAVGEPPIGYLLGRRVALAADLLRQTGDTVAAIARKVGYANAFALSVAFKRRRGMSPTEHRASYATLTRRSG
ncbi:AraC family transcriptional regulator [Phytohabitans flavus]|uniref:AraC family transcriptional regulator n=1 Tax=Phytohabitans flavus TaxID=1076124 RepID=A0A6F8XQW1_9ACTN|nr:AraC family transcriptional regulator [Phytohabitans flavus]